MNRLVQSSLLPFWILRGNAGGLLQETLFELCSVVYSIRFCNRSPSIKASMLPATVTTKNLPPLQSTSSSKTFGLSFCNNSVSVAIVRKWMEKASH